MLRSLLAKLNQAEPAPMAADESRLALAVLLVRVGRSDDEFVAAEVERVETILSFRFGLTSQEAKTLRLEAEEIEQNVSDNVRFTRALKHAVPLEDRVGLVEALWEVALADEYRDDTEDGLLRLVCRLLGVNDRERAFARQRVIAKTKN